MDEVRVRTRWAEKASQAKGEHRRREDERHGSAMGISVRFVCRSK